MNQHDTHATNTPTRPGSTATFRPCAIAVAGLTSLLMAAGALAACSRSTPADAPPSQVPSTVTTVTTASTSSGAGDCSSSATCPDGRDKTGKKSSERGF
jgi:hypothetical protein